MKELIVEEREKANYYSMNDSDRNVTPPLCVTMGDINGIGPEVIARAAHDPAFWSAYPLVVIGDVAAYEASRLPGDPRAGHRHRLKGPGSDYHSECRNRPSLHLLQTLE